MAAFEVVALGVAAGGLGAVVWALLPWLRPPETPAAPDLPPDVALALQKIHERVVLTDDDGTPWLPSPLRPGEERLPADLRPWEGVVVLEGPSPALVPLGPCLLEAHGAPDLLVGRRQGRPILAARIEGDVYLDLFEAVRLLPVLGVELAARGLDGPLALYREGDVPHETLVAAAPWLVSGVGGRVVPEGEGSRAFRFRLAGKDVEVTAWMPTVARGITEDGLRWAGTLAFAGHTCTGATTAEDLERLGVAGATDIGWTRRELLELAAILQQLESQDVDLS
ncbi:MAG: hypothetical protein KC656_15435, partial [Myxococcales bacterium]|nr:hypothetical protein [Myxococcales bacterium]